MWSNDTCRTLRHYNEPVAVKLKGVDSQLDTDQCPFLSWEMTNVTVIQELEMKTRM